MSDGVTVVVPSVRLVRHYRLRHARSQQAAGRFAWSAPDIIAWDHWLARLWQRSPNPFAVLGPLAAALRWERLLAADVSSGSVPRMAELARSALRLLRQWRLPTADLADHGSQDARRFAAWLQQYEIQARERAELDPEDLGGAVLQALVSGQIRPEARLLWLGFPRLVPLAEALYGACQAAGATMARHPGGTYAGQPAQWRAADAADELAAAAGWIRAQLVQEDADVGLVIPDLAKRRDEVEMALVRLLAPGAADAVEAGINFSSGRALAEEPVIVAARTLLDTLSAPPSAPLQFVDASRLLRSAQLGAARAEAGARARLERELREANTTELSLAMLQHQLERCGECPSLATTLQVLQRHRAEWPTHAGTARWGMLVDRALRAAGWPGEQAPGSRVFQVLQRWRDTLGDLAAEDAALGSLTPRAYLNLLARQLHQRQFQAQLPTGRIEVIGTLEAAGREYSALWISGMVAERWPPPLRPHPLLPLALQRAHHLPLAEPAAALRDACEVMQALCGAAPQVVFSWPWRDGASEATPSPFLLNLRQHEPGTEAPAGWAELQLQTRPAMSVHADPAPPLGAHELEHWPVSMLELQQRCPLVAFAHYRLRARPLETPVPALSALLRGQLAHRILELFWAEHGLDDAWRTLSDETLLAIFGDCGKQAARQLLRADTAFERAVIEVEIRRQQALLLELMRLERARGPFSIAALEQRISLQAGDITLTGKADRIDRLESGVQLVLDYKSGIATRGRLHEPRMDAPQLPAYALALGEQVQGMGFVVLRADAMGYHGVHSDDIELLPGTWTALPPEAWQALRDRWRTLIDDLVVSFVAGDARIDLNHAASAAGAFAVFSRLHDLPAAVEVDDVDA
jgi:ATP-dependent helicase/nuclease subunit B